MNKPENLPALRDILSASEITWPAASRRHIGAWTVREGQDGGKRVSAATKDWPVTEADLFAAENAMRALHQTPLFCVRDGEEALDKMLEDHGYGVIDPVNVYAMPVAELAGNVPDPGTVFTMWPPIAIVKEFFEEGGIGSGRQAVMERADCEKAAIFVQISAEPGGAAYIGISKGIAVIHAIFVPERVRRRGAATLILKTAANWAQKHGATTLALIVTQGNHAANPLYASLGMRLVGHYHYRIKEA
ncbi:MAG: GNAT family N-acetyltransferase [Rhodobacterales bacterium]|nr:MAG: GNAT family N-acetyltransferase [Rhodobacterales bacterium]